MKLIPNQDTFQRQHVSKSPFSKEQCTSGWVHWFFNSLLFLLAPQKETCYLSKSLAWPVNSFSSISYAVWIWVAKMQLSLHGGAVNPQSLEEGESVLCSRVAKHSGLPGGNSSLCQWFCINYEWFPLWPSKLSWMGDKFMIIPPGTLRPWSGGMP